MFVNEITIDAVLEAINALTANSHEFKGGVNVWNSGDVELGFGFSGNNYAGNGGIPYAMAFKAWLDTYSANFGYIRAYKVPMEDTDGAAEYLSINLGIAVAEVNILEVDPLTQEGTTHERYAIVMGNDEFDIFNGLFHGKARIPQLMWK